MKRLITFAWLAVLAAGAAAQTVQDPTRPPAQLLRPSAAGAAVAHAPQLQSILIGRAAGGRRVAVIDGDTVRVGDVVHGARVVAIAPADVTLQRGGQRSVLKLNAPDAAPAVAPAVAPLPGKPE